MASQLGQAWGPGSLGVVAVRGVPRWQDSLCLEVKPGQNSMFTICRGALLVRAEAWNLKKGRTLEPRCCSLCLRLSHKLAHLSPESLRAIEDEALLHRAFACAFLMLRPQASMYNAGWPGAQDLKGLERGS